MEGRILLIEDRADWRRRLTKYLQQEGYYYKTAGTYDEALATLNKESFDVVLVDLRLADWDDTNFQGMELLPRINQLRKETGTQAIVVTAYPTPETVREAFHNHGVADFFMKADLDPQKLKQAIRKAVGTASKARSEILKIE